MNTNGIIDLDGLPVVSYGKYADIRRSPEDSSSTSAQSMYKTFRIPLGGVGAKSFDFMIEGLLQPSLIEGMVHDNLSLVSAIDARISGTRVPTVTMPWYKNSNILVYLSQNVDVDRNVLVTDIARGLAVLHSHDLIHGNLHPGNILITDDCRACIADVGLYPSTVQTIHASTDTDHHHVPSSWPYKSGEEISNGTCNLKTDVYSFACTVYSIYQGKPIFSNSTCSFTRRVPIILESGHAGIFGDCKPLRMRENLWNLLGRCWSVDSAGRPTMAEVLEDLIAFGAV